jgi:tetratricopeptide (TPR) repeat protein
MIVRNEAAIIERCLDSAALLIDAAVICDTGSADGTAERASAWLRRRGIPGQVLRHAWVDFATNRNALLAASHACTASLGWRRDRVQWLLLDADHELVVEPGFSRHDLTGDAILLRQRTDAAAWWNLRLAHARVDWRVVGATHEHYEPLDLGAARRLRSLWIRDHADGGSRTAKFARDVALLSDTLRQQPSDSRSMFYLAQSYGAQGETIKALVLYSKRIAAGGPDEETWHAVMAVGRLYAATGDVAQASAAFLQARTMDPERAEPSFELARLLRTHGRLEAAAAYAADAAALPEPQRLLMVDERVYQYRAALELARSAVGTSLHRKGAEACERLMLQRGAPPAVQAEARVASLSYVEALRGAMFLRLQPRLEPPWRPCNPSIVRAGEGYLVNCRAVNYEQRRLRYRPLDDDRIFRTRNILLPLDRDGRACGQREVAIDEAPLRAATIQGLEDCRLFTWRGDTWMTCATADRHPSGRIHQSLCEIRSDGQVVQHRPLTGRFDALHQKNWLPFENQDGAMCAVYGYDPVTILRLDPRTGAYDVAARVANLVEAQGWRGSAGPIPWPPRAPVGWLLLVHEAIERDGPDGLRERVYTHRFVECDRSFALTRASAPFVFAHQGVEYACGMCHTVERDGVLIGLGVEDREAYLCRVPQDRIDLLMRESVATTLLTEGTQLAKASVTGRSAIAAPPAADDDLDGRIEAAIVPLHGWATPEKAACLARLILEARADLSVEIGVFGGRGTIAMAMAHQTQGHGHVVGIDPWAAAASLEGENSPENDEWWLTVDYAAVFASFVEAIARHGLTRQVRIMRQRSEDAVGLFRDRTIAVLHQDGNHSEQISSAEVLRWTPKLRPGGYWIADDCDWPTTAKALALLEERGFALVDNRGSWRVYRKP